jgi:large subunit ribosomal protein L13
LSSRPKKGEAKARKGTPRPTAPASPAAPAGNVLYIDASGHIAGRLCSKVAHEIIRGKRVVVLNSERALFSGNRDAIISQFKDRLELGSKVNPMYGPLHPRRPDNILWKMVRGMVPKEKTKGTEGLRRLRVYMGVPSRYAGVPLSKVDDALATRPLPMYTTVAEVSKSIGWNG